MQTVKKWLIDNITQWLVKEGPPPNTPLCDFGRLCDELKPGDIVLVAGRSRVSEVIKLITQSSWTHAALYVGRISEIRNANVRCHIGKFYNGDMDDQVLIEALLDQGTIVDSISKYQHEHLRICRPQGLDPKDALRVLTFTAKHLGAEYNIRQLLDLARFLFPWSFFPRRWRSSLFEHNPGGPTRTVCSHLLAEAFSRVDFPILPFIDRSENGEIRFFKRNTRLFTPRDFDYSPYFEIVKYPFLAVDELGLYRRLPWCDKDRHYNDDSEVDARLSALEEMEPEPNLNRKIHPIPTCNTYSQRTKHSKRGLIPKPKKQCA